MWSELAAARACAEKIGGIFSASEQAFDLRLIGSLQPDAQHLKKVLEIYSSEQGSRPRSVLMLVGPEGDFTPPSLRSRGVTAASRSHSDQLFCEWKQRRSTA